MIYHNYQRPVELRPTRSSERNDAPDGRYVRGRAPDESVWSYRARVAISYGIEPPPKPEARKRAWRVVRGFQKLRGGAA